MKLKQILFPLLALSLFHATKLTETSQKRFNLPRFRDSGSNEYYGDDNKKNGRFENDFVDSSTGNREFYGEDENHWNSGNGYRAGSDYGFLMDEENDRYRTRGGNRWNDSFEGNNDRWRGHGGSNSHYNNRGENYMDDEYNKDDEDRCNGENARSDPSCSKTHNDAKNNLDMHSNENDNSRFNEDSGGGGGGSSGQDSRYKMRNDNSEPHIKPERAQLLYNQKYSSPPRPSNDRPHKDVENHDSTSSSKPQPTSQDSDSLTPNGGLNSKALDKNINSKPKPISSTSNIKSVKPKNSAGSNSDHMGKICPSNCEICPNCGMEINVEIAADCIGCDKCICSKGTGQKEVDDNNNSNSSVDESVAKNCGSFDTIAEKCCNMLFLVQDEFPPCNNFNLEQCKVTNDDLNDKSSQLYILYLGTTEKWNDEYSKMVNEAANKMRRTIESFILRTYSSNDNFQDSIVLEFRNDKDMVQAKVAVRFINEVKGDIIEIYKAIMCGCGCEFLDSTSVKIEKASSTELEPYCSKECTNDVCSDENFITNGISGFNSESGCDPICCLIPLKAISATQVPVVEPAVAASLMPIAAAANVANGAAISNAASSIAASVNKMTCDPSCVSLCSSMCKPECCLPSSLLNNHPSPFLKVFKRTIKTNIRKI